MLEQSAWVTPVIPQSGRSLPACHGHVRLDCLARAAPHSLCTFRMASNAAAAEHYECRWAVSRRTLAAALLVPFLCAGVPSPASSAGLADRLRTRKAEDLSKPMLPSFVAIPTPEQVFPAWLEGEWKAAGQFAGFELPVKEISKKQLMADREIPGFEKLSVLTVPDMAAPLTCYPPRARGTTADVVLHQLRFVKGKDGKVRLDREFTLASIINSGLGITAVREVKCSGDRCTVDFVRGSTRNAERVELLYVAREAQEPQGGAEGLFVASEFVRQVTLGLSKQYGVAREVIGEYQTFSTFVPGSSPAGPMPPQTARLNLLTAAYLQPQDNLFFQATNKPVVVYSNDFRLTRI